MDSSADLWSKVLRSLFSKDSVGHDYAALADGEIRVIDLLPGAQDDNICCTLRHISLNNLAQSYTALSYTWGNTKSLRSIICDGQPRLITSSLFSALHRLRHPNDILTIWADAICINQGNSKERAQQVVLMGRIYQQSTLAIVDLGDIDKLDESLTGFLLKACDAMVEIGEAELDDSEFEQKLLEHGCPEISDPGWSTIIENFFGPWFRRVWVIQEFALAKEVKFLISASLSTYDDYLNLMARLTPFFHLLLRGMAYSQRRERWKSFAAMTNLLQVRENMTSSQPQTLLQLLIQSRMCNASDPRDKIFALVGLASDAEHPALAINYDLSPTHLFRKVARCLLERDNAIDLLLEAGGGEADLERFYNDLPSWAPDWSKHYPLRQGFERELWDSDCALGRISFGAAGPSEAQMRFVSDKKLAVRGAIIDKVVASAGVFRADIDNPDLNDWEIQETVFDFELEARKLMETLSQYPTGESVLDAYCKTLTLYSIKPQSGLGVQTFQELMDCYASFLSYRKLSNHKRESLWEILARIGKTLLATKSISKALFEESDGDSLTEECINAREKSRPFNTRLGKVAQGKRFCITEKGYIGLGTGAYKDDLVCLFNGSPFLFILEQDVSRDEQYYLRGPCYIHGLMDGEALEADDFREREILLY